MSFSQLIENLIEDTLGSSTTFSSLVAFSPELALCTTILVLLLLRMLAPRWKEGPWLVMLLGTAVAFLLDAPWQILDWEATGRAIPIFTGMLLFDPFAIYMRGLLLFFVLLFAVFTRLSGIPRSETAAEFFVLILGATLGMCLMVSANHMLIVFLGIEMASVPSYVLAGFLRKERQAGEAALKYAVFGAGAAGVMLYGISLLVGVLGSAHLPTMANQLAAMLPEMAPGGLLADRTMLLLLGGLMLMVGLAFKLSAVPFHFWAPDVFEGATAEVALFLSIASKAAALALLVRLALGFGFVSDATALTALEPARYYIAALIGVFAAITCTFGNLAAYGQTRMKRLLAYSTIAHAGYMMMPVAAAVILAGSDPEGGRRAIAAVGFYLAIYLFMNLGAFAVVAFMRNELGNDHIESYSGLVRRSPGVTICFSLILISLIGIPPAAGFAVKFTAFAAVYDAGLLTLLVIGVLNSVLSLFYYMRIVRTMALDSAVEHRPVPTMTLSSAPGMFLSLVTVPLLVYGLWWSGLFDWATAATSTFLR